MVWIKRSLTGGGPKRQDILHTVFRIFSIKSIAGLFEAICRFRNNLLELDLYEKLFEEINRQIESKGILVKESNGAILDATIIESSRRPRKVVEIMQEDRKEGETDISSTVTYSDDIDAAWIKKGKSAYYGFKAHISVDAKEGHVLGRTCNSCQYLRHNRA